VEDRCFATDEDEFDLRRDERGNYLRQIEAH